MRKECFRQKIAELWAFFFFWLKTVIAKVLLQKYKLFLYMFCTFVLESKARYKAPEVMGA